MENLKIYGTDGKVLLERDLADEKGPLMILSGAEPRLVYSVPQGEEVLGALVRDDDGWVLASAKPDIQVASGPKAGQSSQLAVGVTCSLGAWAFRLDAAAIADGPVLVWRTGSGPAAVERLVQGRNTVVRSSDGTYAVNPPVAGGESVCDIFPAGDSADIVTSGAGAQRLSVGRDVLFSVGRFQAMVMDASDAAAAVKYGNPFSWPSRGTRAGLLAGILVVGLVGLCALFMTKELGKVEAAVAARTGAVESQMHHEVDVAQFTDEDALVYINAFFKSLPMMLRAEQSSVTGDLISRGKQLADLVAGANAQENARMVRLCVKFMEDVYAIQDSVRKGDWENLKAILASADRESFVLFDAGAFYDDAEKVADFVTVRIPNFMAAISRSGVDELADAGERIDAYFESLSDNIFMSGEVVRRERDEANEMWRTLSDYMPMREAFISGGMRDISALIEAWAELSEVFDTSDPAFAPLMEYERRILSETLVKNAAEADDIKLIPLCALGEAIGMDEAVLSGWRHRADAARKELAKQYRELYSEYRMKSAVAPSAPETLSVLDAMIALGLDESPYHQWALREKERVAAGVANKKGGDAK